MCLFVFGKTGFSATQFSVGKCQYEHFSKMGSDVFCVQDSQISLKKLISSDEGLAAWSHNQ